MTIAEEGLEPRGKAERLVARVSAAQKRLFERAAALEGRSLSDFVIASVNEAARRAVQDHDAVTLSVRDSEAFVAGLLDPPPVNDRLRETVRRYRVAQPVRG